MPVPRDWFQRLSSHVEERKAMSLAPEHHLGDNPFPNFVVTEKVSTWNQFLSWTAELEGSWCFRGQLKSNWGLHTSLDRAVEVWKTSKNSWSYWHLGRFEEERSLLFRFQQQARQYLPSVPSADDRSSWLA